MSYCRWSSDDFRCDLYCYEDVGGGWTTCVARSKRVIPADAFPPEIPWVKSEESELKRKAWAAEWFERHQTVMKMLDNFPLEPIGLPYDGETYNDPNLELFLARLLMLREAGYRFPDHVLEDVKKEMSLETKE